MVWWAISLEGKLNLEVIEGTLNGERYLALLKRKEKKCLSYLRGIGFFNKMEHHLIQQKK